MKNNEKIKIVIIALAARILFCILGWQTSFIESYEHNISIVYQRSAYLISFGYGYMQTTPPSSAYTDLMSEMDHVRFGEDFNSQIDSVGLYQFEQYPPGWSMLAAGLFKITHVPVPFIMQAAGILIDLISLLLFIKVFETFFSIKSIRIASLIYAIYPPVLAIALSMTPDSWMIFFIALILYIYFIIYPKKKYRAIILIGIITGVATLFRPDFLFITAFIFLGDLFLHKNFIEFFKIQVSIYVLAFLTLMPWGLYNLKHNNHFDITSTALGGTLVTGFATYNDPLNLGPSDIDRQEEVKKVGIEHPFEKDGDRYFKKQYFSYIKTYPDYYLKTILYRTVFFLAPPHIWGIEQHDNIKYSDLQNQGHLISSIQIILQKYAVNLISALFALLGNVAILILFWKNKKQPLPVSMFLIGLCIYLSHVFIYMTPVYVMPLVFFQLIALTDWWLKYRQTKTKRHAV